ncbi:family 10 glycosylhydrolase [Flammeovirgaceae bacterium SG7u.111]|nr:family 10 glycosylhydrolase [Flammeovirgaceae bacterium SG7u.132]WPO35586.1 family 10 glycosylhydrolase [Flammeovirgaceae bacterium SG7u.111]
MQKRIRKAALIFIVLLSGIIITQFVYYSNLAAQVPPPKREFRAIWITTLNNMDWPSRKGMSVEQQKEEFINILDRCQKTNLNAVIVQIRPAADAFYMSKYEPWSEWLGGKQGKPAESGYDPLSFMLEETHKRNMEFHAWINPLRAVYNTRFSNVHKSHISNTRPEWMLQYGTMKVFNPGLPEVRKYLVNIVADIVERYDIDGIHFDDYFYPFPQANLKLDDKATYRKYKGGFKNIKDWRRNNIDLLIKDTHRAIKSLKPYVKFGVSPAGVWRNIYDSPQGSNTRGGITSYDHLHADVRGWLQKGWVDYLVPQVYFSTQLKAVNYRTLVRWWNRNSFDRHVYIGHAAFKVYWDYDKTWYNRSEIPLQLRYNRSLENISGSVYFRAESFMRNRGHFRDSLELSFYQKPALIPSMPWIDNTPPLSPREATVSMSPKGISIHWKNPGPADDGQSPSYYVIYKMAKTGENYSIEDAKNIFQILPASDTSFLDKTVKDLKQYDYLITSVDRLHNESIPAIPIRTSTLVMGKWPYEDVLFMYNHYQKGMKNYFGWLISL